jgi:hypothetical protein
MLPLAISKVTGYRIILFAITVPRSTLGPTHVCYAMVPVILLVYKVAGE